MFQTAFNPAKLTVVAGDTVTWRNGDIVVHDVKGRAFTSGVIGRFGSFSQRFDTPGHGELPVQPAPRDGGAAGGPRGAADRAGGDLLRGRDRRAEGAHRPRLGGHARARGRRLAARGQRHGGADGTFKASVEAAAGYRARTAAGESPAVTATVLRRPKVKLRAAKGRLKVSTTPAAKGLTARFEERRASAWRAFATVKLDAAGRASVKDARASCASCSPAASPRSRRARRSGADAQA